MKRMIEQQQNLLPIFPMEMKYAQTSITGITVTSQQTGTTSQSLSSTVDSVSSTMSTVLVSLCDSCCRPICDRYIMKVMDITYHEKCLQCTSCSIRLTQSCFVREGKLFCRLDYERLFVRNRCLGCGDRIGPDEFVMRTTDNVFHLKCFVCVVCGIRLQKGEQYVIKQSQLFCRSDYEKEVEMLQAVNDEFYCEDIFQNRIDGRRGPKRPRTILTTQQRRAFKASFEVSPKPCRKVRETLARDTGLSIRIVQVWFQNQRAKVKKIQNKARQEGKSKDGGDMQSDCNGDNDSKSIMKIKDENQSDSDSFASGISHDDISYRPIKEELENDEEFFKITASFNRNMQNCDDISGNNNNNIKNENIPPLNTLMNLGYNSLQQMVAAHSQILNPIDRLYSMQNQYFKSEDINQHINDNM